MNTPKIHSAAAVIAVALGIVAPPDASATVVTPGSAVTIVQSYAYTMFDGGDFVFSTSIAAAGCGSGWYMKATDPGYRAAVSTVLTAQAAGLQVIVYGDNADLWVGSTGQYCRVQTVGISS
jgi:hypothetical protein